MWDFLYIQIYLLLDFNKSYEASLSPELKASYGCIKNNSVDGLPHGLQAHNFLSHGNLFLTSFVLLSVLSKCRVYRMIGIQNIHFIINLF